MRKSWTLPLLAAAVLVAAPAQAREARCVIRTGDELMYQGPCEFAAERGGSFSVEPADGGTFADDVTLISVTMLGDGEAEVRGLTTGGISSSLGRAQRSDGDRACWVGEEISVCAY